MVLPTDFIFSQHSLQDYIDCKRRFRYRYIQGLPWPAVESEPVAEHERRMHMGATLHRMIQQHILGIPAERLDEMTTDSDLSRWWRNYIAHTPADFDGRRIPEAALSTSINEHRLYAKYDLLVVPPDGKLTIVDWKTSARPPDRSWLYERMQTRVYRFVLVRAGSQYIQGSAVDPEKVEMIYWYTEHPDQAMRFAYNRDSYLEDETILEEIISTIRESKPDEFPLTDDLNRCRFCQYRSLCERGDVAGSLSEWDSDLEQEDDFETIFDFEQIAEIEF